MTIVANLSMCRALEAADELAKEGISAEVIDPRTCALDYDTPQVSKRPVAWLSYEPMKTTDGRPGGFKGRSNGSASDAASTYYKGMSTAFNPLEAAVIPSVKEIIDASKATLYR